MSMTDYSIIDAVCNIWTPEALSHRPGWTDEFFVGKVKGKHDSAGITLETMIEGMDEAGIDVAFLVAAKAGRGACLVATTCPSRWYRERLSNIQTASAACWVWIPSWAWMVSGSWRLP